MAITLFYDSDCVLCTTYSRKMQSKNAEHINISPVKKSIKLLARYQVSFQDAMTYVYVLHHESDTMYKGMPAVRLLCQTANDSITPWLSFPVMREVCDYFYPMVARNRYRFPHWFIRWLYGFVAPVDACRDGVCHLPPHKRSQSTYFHHKFQ